MNYSAAHLATRPRKHPKAGSLTIFVLIDALGWEIIKDRPFLNAELPYRKPLKTVLGFSSGAIPTILTGLTPAQTGHWNMYYYDPERSPFKWMRPFLKLPERIVDNRYSRKLIKELGRRVLGMGPLFECNVSPFFLPHFDWVEKKNIYAVGGIPGAVSIFDLLEQNHIPHRIYSYHSLTDEEILDQATRDVEHGDGRVFFLYLSEMDGFLHARRDERNAVDARLSWYESKLRVLFERALRKDPDASLSIASDHGMTPVHSSYDLVGRIEALGFEMPSQYLAVYDSTMARFWFFDDRARDAVVAELARTQCGRILDDRELRELGVYFEDHRYGEVVFLLEPGWLFSRSDFNGGGWNPTGMHGYHPSDPNSDAILLSNRFGSGQMRSILDLYTHLEESALR